MPKLDLDAIPQTNATGYPAPFDADVGGHVVQEPVEILVFDLCVGEQQRHVLPTESFDGAFRRRPRTGPTGELHDGPPHTCSSLACRSSSHRSASSW